MTTGSSFGGEPCQGLVVSDSMVPWHWDLGHRDRRRGRGSEIRWRIRSFYVGWNVFFLILWSGFWMILDDFLQISFQILSGFHGTFMWVLLGGVTRTWRSDPPNHGGFHRISVVSYKDQWGYTVSNKGWNSLVGCWFQFCVTTNYRLARKEWFLGKILASPSGIQRSAGEWLRVGSS